MNKVLTEGPWFVMGHFLSIWKWEPNFVPAESKLAIAAIWIRLSHLPTEFYDRVILEQVGNRVRKLLKIDTCTSSTLNPNPTTTTTGTSLAKDSLWQTVSFKRNKKETHKGNHLPRLVGASPEQHSIQGKQYSEATGTFLDLVATNRGGGGPKAHEHLNLGEHLGPMGWATETQQNLKSLRPSFDKGPSLQGGPVKTREAPQAKWTRLKRHLHK